MGAFLPRRPGSEAQTSNNYNFEARHNNMRQFLGFWSVAIVVVCVLAALSLESARVEAYPNQHVYQNGMRINRRGFRSSLLSTARGFGKRSDPAVDLEADSMPTAYDTVALNPRMLAYLLKTEDGGGAAGDWHHRAEDY